MDSDFVLIQKMKAGNVQAIDTFVRKYYPAILNYCHLHIRDYGYAEDMAQETFERFFRTFHNYRHYGKVMNFLYVIAANCCKNHYRKRSEIAAEHLAEQADDSMAGIDDRIDVHRALDKLPDEIKEVAILFFFQELKQNEISRILRIGLPLVKYRVRRAKELLRAALRSEHLEPDRKGTGKDAERKW